MGLRVAMTHAFCWPEVRRGGERYLHEAARALASRGHEVTILAGAPDSRRMTWEGTDLVRVRRASAPTARAEQSFALRAMPKLLRARFDVVHSLGARDAVAALAARRIGRVDRVVYTCLGVPDRVWWDRRYDRRAHERVVDGIDVYGCLSAFAQRKLQEGYGRGGAITSGGVNTSAFTPECPRAGEPTILFPAAVDVPRKGLDVLLQAVAILARTEPRVRLCLTGPGDVDRAMAGAPAAARERTVHLGLGEPDAQAGRYASAWVTALPSRSEAFGLVVLESFACGTPVVVSDDAALPELVAPGTGALAPLDDPHALAGACAKALELAARPETVERCREVARAYDWRDGIAPALEALYRGLARDTARA